MENQSSDDPSNLPKDLHLTGEGEGGEAAPSPGAWCWPVLYMWPLVGTPQPYWAAAPPLVQLAGWGIARAPGAAPRNAGTYAPSTAHSWRGQSLPALAWAEQVHGQAAELLGVGGWPGPPAQLVPQAQEPPVYWALLRGQTSDAALRGLETRNPRSRCHGVGSFWRLRGSVGPRPLSASGDAGSLVPLSSLVTLTSASLVTGRFLCLF